jgi:hypothetical protein
MLPWPIRYDRATWLCMRNDPVLPKAIIKRVWVWDKQSGERLMKFRAVTWDLDPAKRTLIGYYNDVGEANNAVRYDIPQNMARVDGRKACRSGASAAVAAGAYFAMPDPFYTPNCPRCLERLQITGTELHPYWICPGCRIAYLSGAKEA